MEALKSLFDILVRDGKVTAERKLEDFKPEELVALATPEQLEESGVELPAELRGFTFYVSVSGNVHVRAESREEAEKLLQDVPLSALELTKDGYTLVA